MLADINKDSCKVNVYQIRVLPEIKIKIGWNKKALCCKAKSKQKL